MLPLVQHALGGKTITYLGLRKTVEPNVTNRWALHYRFVAGRVGDICEALSEELGERVPPLNAIIVNQGTELPSEGVDSYLGRFLGFSSGKIGRLSQEERNVYARQAIQTVFDYDKWPQVCRQLQLRVPATNRSQPPGAGSKLPDQKKFATGPESAAHKALKLWAVSNPAFFADYGAFANGQPEVTLSSGDRLDGYFENSTMRLAVEVKCVRSPPEEIVRGVFQCVKYRSVLRAMQLVEGRPPNAQAVLVLDGPAPVQVVDRAAMLTVRILEVGKLLRSRS